MEFSRISLCLLVVTIFFLVTKAKPGQLLGPISWTTYVADAPLKQISNMPKPSPPRQAKCNVSEALKQEIASYAPIVAKIAQFAINGSYKGYTYNQLADCVDTFGSRIAGSKNLENAIDYMVKVLNGEQLENVHTEEVDVPHWVRGNESAALISPRYKKLAILGLGGSVGTPMKGITAEVLVVKSFDELKAKAAEAKGKIVVYNQDFISYGKSVQYRQYGAVRAAEVGAVASLIRSIAPFSINSPHTGWQDYSDKVPKIPTACITIEDAEMLWRMATRLGQKMVITLQMEAQNLPMAKSRNTVAEIKGSLNPDQVVLVSGHLDSWDVGQGAMDDGAGAFISWSALSLLRKLGLRPRRTMRAVLWTGEEEGLWGAQAYYAAHLKEMDNFDLVMESDIGTFQPTGLSFSGSSEATCIMQEVVKLLDSMGATQLVTPSQGSDIDVFTGIPQASLLNKNDKYFWFHHSEADMLTVENSDVLDVCTAVWAATSFVVANLKDMLPR